jgi:hypothetical protein
MSSFFGMAPDGSGLQVSPKFWIFWAFAIPITLIVLATFTLWIQRQEISDLIKGVMHSCDRRKSINQDPDVEKARPEKTSVSGKS